MNVSKNLCDGEHNFFFGNERVVSVVLYRNNFISYLLGIQHLLEILETSLTVKNSENGVKSGCFKKLLQWRVPIFF